MLRKMGTKADKVKENKTLTLKYKILDTKIAMEISVSNNFENQRLIFVMDFSVPINSSNLNGFLRRNIFRLYIFHLQFMSLI